MSRNISMLLGVLLLLLMPAAHADQFTVTAGHSEVLFDTAVGVPVRWTVCQSACSEAEGPRAVLLDIDDGYIQVSNSSTSSELPFSYRLVESADAISVLFQRGEVSYSWLVSKLNAGVQLELPPGSQLTIATGQQLVPEQLPGLGQMYSRVNGITLQDGNQQYLDPDVVVEGQLNETDWLGVRSSYWGLLLKPVGHEASYTTEMAVLDRPVVNVSVAQAAVRPVYQFYAGPIEWGTLRAVAPELSELLFGALWDFMRVLCFGMLLLLDWLQSWTGSFGLAIVLLSLSNKILMTPLTMLADRWQADVNRIQTLLDPELVEIKRLYKGEEAHERTLALYKKHDVSMLYSFKSAAGFLIQIPVFIAVFDMLGENIALNQVAFLWISDLAKPDSFASLPFVLPFFGGSLNLLPFIMTGLSILAAWLQAEDTLSPALQRKQSIRLYLMASAFFILFYTFPAGMVLYWTSSNVFHLLKVESGRLFKRA
jgi:YidC/Oxa1 family membrane protein insertase